MATFIKEEPGSEDEETIMSHITIKNEPGTSVVLGDNVTAKAEHKHNVIRGSSSVTVGPVFETEHPLINKTSTRPKDEITVKDETFEHIQDTSFDKSSNNSNDKCSHSEEDSNGYISRL